MELMDGDAVLARAEQELIRRCMARQGFTYTMAPVSNQLPRLAREYGQTVSDAQRVGYSRGLMLAQVTRNDAMEAAARSESRKLPPEQRKKFSEALRGGTQARIVTVSVPGVGDISAKDEGCASDAWRTLYGSLESGLKAQNFPRNLQGTVEQRATNDPHLRTLNAKWSECMKGKGKPGIADPGVARSRAAEMTAKRGTRAASPGEVALAVADAECEAGMNYASQRTLLEDRYLTAGLHRYEAEVAAVREINRLTLRKARTTLGG